MTNTQGYDDIYTNVHDLHEVRRALQQVVSRLQIARTVRDANRNELLEFGETDEAVNHVKITNVVTGDDPEIQATGDDTNVDLVLRGKTANDGVYVAGNLDVASGKQFTAGETKYPTSIGNAGDVLIHDGVETASWGTSKESHIPLMDAGTVVSF